MLTSDIHALRDLLLSICGNSDLDTLTQRDAQTVLHGILNEARRVLADVAYAWNGAHAMFRLPHELLAECFSFLPFHCRVSASQVCRTWRTAALNTPSLWADITGIDSSVRLTTPLVRCALLRAGNVSLHFAYRQKLDRGMSRLVRSTMHRMKSLGIFEWTGASPLRQSAPLLESLHLWQNTLLPEDFLAGSPATLVTVEAYILRFPQDCPALSNLTTLILEWCWDSTLRDTFRLCPRLRSLTARNMSWERMRPIGHPPESLSDLRLRYPGDRYNVTEAYEAFRHCPKLENITLEQLFNHSDLRMESVPEAVVELDVTCAEADGTITVNVRSANGRLLRLVLHGLQGRMYPSLTSIFTTYNGGFGQLRTLRIPLCALPAFAKGTDPLPDAEIYLDIADEGGRFTEAHKYLHNELRPLAVLAPRKAVIVVAPHSAGDGPTEDDARALVAELAKVPRTVQLTVHGFPREAVPDDLFKAPNITFDRDSAPV